jgi:hypothetical protein
MIRLFLSVFFILVSTVGFSQQNPSAEDIINNYLEAIAGKNAKSKLLEIKSYYSEYELRSYTLKGQSNSYTYRPVLNISVSKTDQNQLYSSICLGTCYETAFNKYRGYNYNSSNKIYTPLSETDILEITQNFSIFPELYLNFSTIKLVGISKIEGENAYEIKFSDNVSEFYSVKTGLKLKKEVTQIIDGKITKREYYYRKYKRFDGIRFPTIIYRTPFNLRTSAFSYRLPQIGEYYTFLWNNDDPKPYDPENIEGYPMILNDLKLNTSKGLDFLEDFNKNYEYAIDK